MFNFSQNYQMAITSEYEYIIDAPTLKERYDRISAIIKGLETAQLAGISQTGKLSYSLDDGQTRISAQYRSPGEIAKAIAEYEKILRRIESEITGTRIVRLADAEATQSNGIQRPF